MYTLIKLSLIFLSLNFWWLNCIVFYCVFAKIGYSPLIEVSRSIEKWQNLQPQYLVANTIISSVPFFCLDRCPSKITRPAAVIKGNSTVRTCTATSKEPKHAMSTDSPLRKNPNNCHFGSRHFDLQTMLKVY